MKRLRCLAISVEFLLTFRVKPLMAYKLRHLAMQVRNLILLAVAGPGLVIASDSRLDGEVVKRGSSISGKLDYTINQDGIFLSRESGAPIQLSEVINPHNVTLLISPDDQFVLVKDGGPSLGTYLSAYRRGTDGTYQLWDGEITDKLLAVAAKAAGFDADQLDHVYSDIVAVAANSRCALLIIHSRGGKHRLHAFAAVYDLDKRTLGATLDEFNSR